MTTIPPDSARDAILRAALDHVPFEGWSDATFRAAVADAGVAPALARALFPRGAVDLALGWHRQGDAAMALRLATADLAGMRYRDRVAFAIRARLEAAGDKESVRRATTLFALPMHAADGTRALWGTADAIWRALGDTSTDVNWYTKRATLSAVYGAAVLFWLGDDSPGDQATHDFVGRRIDDVMQIEKLKGQLRENPVTRPLAAATDRLFGWIRAPRDTGDLPGQGADPFADRRG